MSRATVLQRVQDLSLSQADATAIDRYYDDVIYDLGRRPWLTEASLIAVTAGTAVYSPDVSVLRIVNIFYDDRTLYESNNRELEATFGSSWQDRRGTPVAYTFEDENALDFRLVPKPELNSKDFSFVFGSPMGLDFPEYSVAIIHTEKVEDLPTWLELPVAFEILFREFSRQSDHQDPTFAVTCKQIAELMFQMIS